MKFVVGSFTVTIVGGGGGHGSGKLTVISCLICKVENIRVVCSMPR